ncbi:hypothetical protein [Salisaeta longa]|uniref:hypothetical protein n=1 Tax=Salisaeta longa TaxID=503170 RepID=UPI0012FA1DF0|nr:hypothetical protein [Salisaeta longa]
MEKESKWKFVLYHGVLLWGYPSGLFAKSIELSPLGVHLPTFDSLVEGAIFLVVWTVSGIAFGSWMWYHREKNRKFDGKASEAS